MPNLKGNLLLEFSAVSLLIMLVLAIAISGILTAEFNHHVWLLKAHEAAMGPEASKGTDPFSVPQIRRSFNNLRWTTWAAIAGGFVLLYFSLLSIVWRNSKTINRQQGALAKANRDLWAANDQLREAQERLVQERMAPILNSAGEGIYGLDIQGNITFANPAAVTMTGWTADDLLGKSHHGTVHYSQPDGTPYPEEACPIFAVLKGAVQQVDHEVFWRKDGTSFPVRYISTPIREQGMIVGAVVTFEDITERRQAERALRESEMRFRSVTQSANDAIVSVDESGDIILWNRGAQTIFGYGEEEVLGKPLSPLLREPDDDIHQRDLERFRLAGVSALVGKTTELGGVRKDGTEFPLELSLATWKAEEGLFYTGIIRDITERKQAEAKLKQANADLGKSHGELLTLQLQLMQAEKLESVGRLAAGVAHEVKNPLSIILMGVNYLSEHPETAGDDGRLILQDMEHAVKRADSVIRGLLDFSAARELDLKREKLNAIVEQSLALVKHELDKCHVNVVGELSEDLPPVELDKSKIQQVFINIFMNAIHAMTLMNATYAMPTGGTLTVRTHAKRLTEVGPNVGSRAGDRFKIGDTVVIAQVEDTGTGIPEDQVTKIFDPFFTTKPTGKGTGLGLAVTNKIIELHGGTIDIRNRKEVGARVTIMFKAQEESR